MIKNSPIYKFLNKIIFEKTSCLLNSNIIISKQETNDILNKIKYSIRDNKSKKIIFNDKYTYLIKENNVRNIIRNMMRFPVWLDYHISTLRI